MPAGGKPFEGRYVLAIGRLHPVKGYPLLVRAFAQMCRAPDDLNLVLAGPDEQGHRREIEAVIRNCAVGARVHLLEAVQGQAKVDLLAHASVFAMPSFSENFGIAAVEAAAYGVPLLVSDRVGLCDAVQKYGAGEVASCDVDSVSDKLSLLFHRQRCYTPARMAQAFSWDARITELESLYRTVLQERQ
jgi:glycosyltransferase involved in cell wall biosynthesis